MQAARPAVAVLALSFTAVGGNQPPVSACALPPGLEERFQPPPVIEWGYFWNADRARIRYCRILAAPAKSVAVLVTGRGEFAEKYFEVMRELRSRGYTVWEMDWMGLGGSDRYLPDPQKGHSLGFERHARDLDRFVTTVVRVEPGTPLFLVAHSMGANIALRYLHDYPRRFSFAVLSAPALSLGSGATEATPGWAVRAMTWGACMLGFRESWARGEGPWRDQPEPHLTHDAVRGALQNRWFRANPRLRTGGPTNGWASEFLRSCDTLADSRYLAAIREPILMGSALGDSLTRPNQQAWACSAIPGCRLAPVEGAWHELFMESDAYRGPWMKAIWTFIERNGVRKEASIAPAGTCLSPGEPPHYEPGCMP